MENFESLVLCDGTLFLGNFQILLVLFLFFS